MNEWISVKEGIPNIGEVVLLYQKFPPGTPFHCVAHPLPRNFTYVGGLRWDGKFICYNDQYSEKGLQYIEYWMPLPEPPGDIDEPR